MWAHDERSPGARGRPTRVAVALGIMVLVAAAVTTLTRTAPRRSGTNYTADTGLVLPLAAGEQLCQSGELVPADTGAVQLRASRGTSTRLEAAISTAKRVLARGVAPGSSGWGTVRIDFPAVAKTSSGTVCIRNLGPRPIAFGGSLGGSPFTAVLGKRAITGRARIEYMRPGRESWADLASTILHRMSLAKSNLVRYWAAVGALVLMLLAVSLAIRTVLREEAKR